MAYRTKVEVVTGGKVFKPGTILPDSISALDLSFLKRRKFVEVVEVDAAVAAADSDEDGEDGDEDFEDGFDEMNPGEYKSADEIRKIRSKKDIYDYALSIGLNLGDDYKEKSLADLSDEVINFQEEKEAEASENV
jgi:hypothetical protein